MVGKHAALYTAVCLALGLLLLVTATMKKTRTAQGRVVKNTAVGRSGQVLGGMVLLMIGMLGAVYLVVARLNP